MTDSRWHSQPYPPEGASAAEGIRNQLGRPELDLLTILVREAAQNSWDARIPDSSIPVEFDIDMWAVSPGHSAAWRELLLAGAPHSAENFPLRETLRRGQIRVLSLSDRGTRGLGGPTRANDAVGSERDFVSFVRNIGEPRETALGGGTYGFGKGIFYLLSRPGTVLVHSRCRMPNGGYETRLIGCALWQSYVETGPEGSRRFTGRHWWGEVRQGVVDPLVGRRAEVTARRLGLRPFGPEETGTTVAVVDPNLDGLEPSSAASYLADTIAWHLWPKMLATQGREPAMHFSVVCDGLSHPVPDPCETRPLSMFVAAYEAMSGSGGKEIACRNPIRLLGRLGLAKRIMPPLEVNRAQRMLGIEDMIHHVCLMRPAELVVTYHPGVKPPSVHQGYAGVFRADESMDDIYAKAEPPTHDAWNPQSLDKREGTFVRTTFRRITEAVDDLLSLTGSAGAATSKAALGAASMHFSGLVGGAWGLGGATDYSKPGSTAPPRSRPRDTAANRPGGRVPGSRDGDSSKLGDDERSHIESDTARSRPRVKYVSDPYYADLGDETVLVQEFRLPAPVPQRVRIELAVTLPGTSGRETDPPVGAAMPELIGWEDETGRLHPGDSCVMEGSEAVRRALVRPAPDTMTEIAIKVEAVRTP